MGDELSSKNKQKDSINNNDNTQRAYNKDIISELCKFGYTTNDIIDAMNHINNKNDINDVIQYITNHQNKLFQCKDTEQQISDDNNNENPSDTSSNISDE